MFKTSLRCVALLAALAGAVLLFNVSMQPDVLDKRIADDAVQQIRQKLEGIQKYPDLDLFSEFR